VEDRAALPGGVARDAAAVDAAADDGKVEDGASHVCAPNCPGQFNFVFFRFSSFGI
jgi:hypothetical protein